MSYELMHGKGYMISRNTMNDEHELILEEDDKFLLFYVDIKNRNNGYFSKDEKESIEDILENGTKRQLIEMLNLQYRTSFDELTELLKEMRGRK